MMLYAASFTQFLKRFKALQALIVVSSTEHAEWAFDAAQGVFEVVLGGFAIASAALTAVSCPQKGPAGSKSARAKNWGGVLFISGW